MEPESKIKVTIRITETRKAKLRSNRSWLLRSRWRLRVKIRKRRFQRMTNSERTPIRAIRDSLDAI